MLRSSLGFVMDLMLWLGFVVVMILWFGFGALLGLDSSHEKFLPRLYPLISSLHQLKLEFWTL
jgi:hypothetical protein